MIISLTSLVISCGLSISIMNNVQQQITVTSIGKEQARSGDIYTPPNGANATVFTDVFENNNSISDATSLCPPNYYQSDSYHTYLDASLHYDSIVPDAGGNLNVPCLLCGGMARIGFLPGYLFANQLNGQSYYVSDSGVIVLNDL